MNNSKRISYKKKCPNPLFEKWLEELYDKAASLENSNSRFTIRTAILNLKKYPLTFQSGTECAILKGFGPKLCTYLNSKLKEHKNVPIQPASSESEQSQSPLKKRKVASDNVATTSSNSDSKPHSQTNQSKKYKPAFRSGAYAILMALLNNFESSSDTHTLTKEGIIECGQQYAEESFITPKPESRYTAWSSMGTLLKKGLVNKTKSRKAEFSLTDEGYLLSLEIKELYKNERTLDVVIDINMDSQLTPILPHSSGSLSQPELPMSQSQKTTSSGRNTTSEIIEMKSGSFEIILLVDKAETCGNRKEDQVTSQLKKYKELNYEGRHLKVGDFLWIAKSKANSTELVVPYIVERKRMDDLSSSIKDGRFHEQKFRLRKSGLKNVIYLIENYGSNKHVGMPIQSLLQAIVNTSVQNGFKIHITNSLSDSIRFLAMMTKRLAVEFKGKDLVGCSGEPLNEELMTFEYFNKTFSKTKLLTVTETFIKILLQIKGISVEKALAITGKYTTPKILINSYESCASTKEAELLLHNLTYGDLNKSVGVKISKTVHQLFTIKQFPN